MAWTVPADFTTGRVVTASDWNAEMGTTGNMSLTAPAVATGANYLIRTTAANTVADSSAMSAGPSLIGSDSATATVFSALTLDHTSSGTPAASFGTGLNFKGKSSTTASRDMAAIQAYWTTATDASRASAIALQTVTGAGSLTTNMTILGSGKVGIGTTTPGFYPDGTTTAQTFLEIRQPTASAGGAGIAVTGDGSSGYIQLSDKSLGSNAKAWRIDGSGSAFTIQPTSDSGATSTSNLFKLAASYAGGAVIAYLGTSTANAKMTTGLTIQQGGADDEIFAGKSSDVAHGMTNLAETDSFVSLTKYGANDGGAYLQGFTEVTIGLALFGRGTTMDTTKSTAGAAPVYLAATKKSGTGTTAMGASDNALVIADGVSGARFIFQADGSAYEDVGTSFTNYDDHDDLALLDSLSVHAARPDDPIHKQFRGWVDSVGREKLQALDLVHFNEDQHHFINRSKVQMLLIGATRQVGGRVADLERKLAETAAELTALRRHPALAGA